MEFQTLHAKNWAALGLAIPSENTSVVPAYVNCDAYGLDGTPMTSTNQQLIFSLGLSVHASSFLFVGVSCRLPPPHVRRVHRLSEAAGGGGSGRSRRLPYRPIVFSQFLPLRLRQDTWYCGSHRRCERGLFHGDYSLQSETGYLFSVVYPPPPAIAMWSFFSCVSLLIWYYYY